MVRDATHTMNGTVAAFDEASGLGEIDAEDGRRIPFHCVAVADGSRTILPGTAVEFELLPKLGRYEATAITPR
jgi:cold shock CspA family protein